MPVDGTWYNELNSTMTIAVDGAMITGTYQTAVGATGQYQLTGALDTNAPTEGPTALGFVVAWNNGQEDNNSVTTWSGQYQTINQNEVLTATWLLTQETDPALNWLSTLVGQDTFTRNPPSAEAVTLRQQCGPAPHPVPATNQ